MVSLNELFKEGLRQQRLGEHAAQHVETKILPPQALVSRRNSA
jgi:hypothetical protein